jgi:uroporphyrinogen-III synthase
MNQAEYNSRVVDALQSLGYCNVITTNANRDIIVIQWQYECDKNEKVRIYTLSELEEMASNISKNQEIEMFVFTNKEDAEAFYNELESEINVSKQ